MIEKITWGVKRVRGGWRATIKRANLPEVCSTELTRDRALVEALKAAQKAGVISQAERERFLIEGRF